jgi:hypothetical protein
MIGTRGTLRHHGTHIHNVPLMFCPVCHHVEVHYLIQHEYDILAQYAVSDGAYEVDFDDYLDERDAARLLDNCVNHENEDPLDIVNNQIDMALDLLAVAKYLKDEEWVSQLKERLRALGSRRRKLEQRKRKALGERK